MAWYDFMRVKRLAKQDSRLDLRINKAAAPTTAVGSAGISSGGIAKDDEFLRELQGLRGVKVYRQMADNSAIIGGALLAIKNLIKQVQYRAEPVDINDAQDVAAAELVQASLDGMYPGFNSTLDAMLTVLEYGHSVLEIVYKIEDGTIYWQSFYPRPQPTLSRWRVDGDTLTSIEQTVQGSGVVAIPADRFLHLTSPSATGSPLGRSILRNAYRPWFFATRLEEVEAIGLERGLSGIPIARVPAECLSSGASAEKRSVGDEFKDLVINIRRDEQEGIVIPSDRDENGERLFDLELLQVSSSHGADIDKAIARKTREQLIALLSDFIILGHETVGSFALSSDKTSLFGVALRGWIQIITTALNNQAVPRLLALNGLEGRVKIVAGDVEKPDLAALASGLLSLSNAGMDVSDLDTENYVRNVFGLPLKVDATE